MLMETEKKCSELRWSEPVRVKLQHGHVEDICGPHEALNCLTHRWTAERGAEYERARQLCMAALARRIPLDNVREAFLIACRDGSVLG